MRPDPPGRQLVDAPHRTGHAGGTHPRLGVDDALLAHAVETAPGAFVSIDGAGCITGWNAASEALFGWPAAEVLGRALAQTIVPPEHRDDHLAGVARVAQTGRSELRGRELALPGMTSSGERIPLTVTIWPSHGPDGLRFHAHLRDARPDAASRRAVEHEQSRFERLARVVPGVVYTFVLDEDGEARYDYVSPACAEVYGFTAEEALADASLMPGAVHPDDRASFRRAKWISGAALEELRWSGRVVHRDGTVRHVAITSRPTLQPGGATEWCGVVEDRTEQADAARTIAQQGDRLEREQAILDAALASLSQAVVACDAEGRVTYLNDAAHRLYGSTGAGPHRGAVHDLVDPTTGAPVPDDRTPLRRTLAGESVDGVRVDLAPAGLPRRRLVVDGRRLTSEAGEVLGAVVSARDVGALLGGPHDAGLGVGPDLDPEADLHGDAQVTAEASAAPEGSGSGPADRLTAELRQSLGWRVDQQLDAVRWGLEVARSHSSPADPSHPGHPGKPGDHEALPRALAVVGRAVERLDGLHRDVWSLVALETGRLVAQPSATPVAAALRAAAALAQEPGSVRVECPEDLRAWVQPEHLHQVLANLVSNADEHAGGPTVLRASLAGDHVLVDVEDAGDGVPDARRGQLFRKLTRAGDPATAARGTALGLFVVRQLTEANQGAVAYQALPIGSRFVVSLPAARG